MTRKSGLKIAVCCTLCLVALLFVSLIPTARSDEEDLGGTNSFTQPIFLTNPCNHAVINNSTANKFTASAVVRAEKDEDGGINVSVRDSYTGTISTTTVVPTSSAALAAASSLFRAPNMPLRCFSKCKAQTEHRASLSFSKRL